MTGITDAKGNKFTYEYDGKHNVTKGTSAQGVVYKLSYDSAGNVIKSSSVEVSPPDEGNLDGANHDRQQKLRGVCDRYLYLYEGPPDRDLPIMASIMVLLTTLLEIS